jgi:hypothetical protein
MIAERRVHFPDLVVASIHSYPALDIVSAALLFYNVEDYRRFRVERAQEEIERVNNELKLSLMEIRKTSRPQSRRDSLTMGRKSAPFQRNVKADGFALAA